MSISFSCLHCGKGISVRDEFAGKRGKCPGCQQVVVIPAHSTVGATATIAATKPKTKSTSGSVNNSKAPLQTDAGSAAMAGTTIAATGKSTVVRNAVTPPSENAKPAAAKAAPTPPAKLTEAELCERLLSAFTSELEPQKISFFSKLGLGCNALFCLSVAVIPWLAIAAVIGGCAWWAISLGAVVPAAIVGTVVTLFLLRPLLLTGSRAKTIPLPRDKEPRLWAFVDRISDVLQAQRPASLEMDCSLDARSSGPGLFGGSSKIVFGLPLAGTLNLPQFAGVVAHELAYYRRGTAAGCKQTMRSVYLWLAELAFEPDALELALARQGKVVRLICLPLTAGDWLVRKFLWLLFEVVYLVAGATLRQQELAADACQATLVGSSTFASTRGQICLLNYAWQGAQADVPMLLKERQLHDNLVSVILTNLQDTPEEVREFIVEQAAAEKRVSYDLRGSDAQRIVAVKKSGAPGMFQCKFPTQVLFVDFAKTAKAVTWEYYRAKYGKQVRQHELRDTPAPELVS